MVVEDNSNNRWVVVLDARQEFDFADAFAETDAHDSDDLSVVDRCCEPLQVAVDQAAELVVSDNTLALADNHYLSGLTSETTVAFVVETQPVVVEETVEMAGNAVVAEIDVFEENVAFAMVDFEELVVEH